jgi:hypothetical protein
MYMEENAAGYETAGMDADACRKIQGQVKNHYLGGLDCKLMVCSVPCSGQIARASTPSFSPDMQFGSPKLCDGESCSPDEFPHLGFYGLGPYEDNDKCKKIMTLQLLIVGTGNINDGNALPIWEEKLLAARLQLCIDANSACAVLEWVNTFSLPNAVIRALQRREHVRSHTMTRTGDATGTGRGALPMVS